MIPPLIVREALHKGLDLIAITDHNTSGNVAAVMKAAAGTGLTVLPGMEFQAQEEVEMLCLFPDLATAKDWQQEVATHLLALENDPERFGPQYVVDSEGDFVREESLFYQGPAQIPLEAAAQKVRALGGLAIPAHIERPAKGLLGVLGLWPPKLDTDAAEVSRNLTPQAAYKRYPFLEQIPLLTNSDAHWLDTIGQVSTTFFLSAPTISELRRALKRLEGRGYKIN